MLGASLAVTLLACSALTAAGTAKSGPKVGAGVPAFHPLNVTGAAAGNKACQV
jgi:hypothetical protein